MVAMNASQITLGDINFSNVKSLDNGGKMLYLNYGGGINPLYVTTPEVDIPFDPSYFPDNDNSGKYSIKFSMKNMEDNKAMKEFHTWACDMDKLLIQKAGENSQAWFKKPKLSEETLRELYTPMVKVSMDPDTGEPNGKYPDSFAFKVVKRDGKFKDFSIYDNKKTVFDVNGDTDSPTDISKVLMKGALIKVVLKCNGVWIANGKFGCTWRAEQIRVKLPEGGLSQFAIDSDSDDEDDGGSSAALPMIEDSSDEEEEVKQEETPVEEVEEVEEEPEPAPEPKKKVVRKVKKVNKD